MPHYSKKKKRILCINCNLWIRVIKYRPECRYRGGVGALVTELEPRVISVISGWISPILITDEDFICAPCLRLAMQSSTALQDNADMEEVPYQRAHKRVCLFCRKSLLKARSCFIVQVNATEIQIKIQRYVEAEVAPRQVRSIDGLCYTCYMKAKRDVLKSEKEANASRQDAQRLERNKHNELDKSDSDEEWPNPDAEKDSPKDKTGKTDAAKDSQEDYTGSITLPNYRRAPNSSSKCLIRSCINEEKLRVPDAFKGYLLNKYKYYIPKNARICEFHKQNFDFESVSNVKNGLNNFTAEHIEDVFAMVNVTEATLGFNDRKSIYRIDEDLFHYWLGMSKNNFVSILNSVPQIEAKKNGVLGLAALLIKSKTGDSDSRLSLLLNIPKSSLQVHMKMIQDIFLQDNAPSSLGVNITEAIASEV